MTSQRTKMSFGILAVLATLLIGVAFGDDMIDVREREDATLECHFTPSLSLRDHSMYWIRANHRDKDNVAIGDTSLDKNYRIVHRPREGVYDLVIVNASYDRDNGRFECHVKEKGTGISLFAKAVQLTVLLTPGEPIITPPAPQATEGKPFEIACASLGGSPDPIITWYRGNSKDKLQAIAKAGGSRTNATVSILTVTPQREEDGVEYYCEVWNRALQGKKLRSSVTLHVNYYPRVAIRPANPFRVQLNETALLTCEVDSKPAVSNVRWTRNGRYLSTDFTLIVSRATLQDAGTYTCSADNGLGQGGEAEVMLDVLYPPILAVESKVSAAAGTVVTAMCNATANPRPVRMEWLKEGDPSFRQEGQHLRLNNVKPTDSGNYICRAINRLNPSNGPPVERDSNATLELLVKHSPGKARISIDRANAVEGGSVTLTCVADPPGWPSPEYRWWNDRDFRGVGPQVKLSPVRLSQEGRYYCKPSNELGMGEQGHIDLTVLQPPRIISPLQPDMALRQGLTNISVTCTAVGKPRPTVHWLKDGEEIGTNGALYQVQTSESVNSGSTITVESTLRFIGSARPQRTQLEPTDRGRYSCVFENEVRREETAMTLRVEHSPIVQHHHNKVAADIGDPVSIVCRMQAHPQPNFEWSVANNPITSARQAYSINVTAQQSDVYQSVLRIASVKESDYGEYVCKAENSFGTTKTLIRLQAKTLPDSPTDLRVLAASYNSITLDWDPSFDGGYANTVYIVSYLKKGYEDLARKEYDCQIHNPCKVTGLEQQQEYMFQVKARNPKGSSTFSHSVSGTTQVDTSRIPHPQEVAFEPNSRTLVFSVMPYQHPLTARIEVKTIEYDGAEDSNDEDSWRLVASFGVSVGRQEHKLTALQDIEEIEGKAQEVDVRVHFCIDNNDAVCGTYVKAAIVPTLPAHAPSSLPLHYVIGIVVAGVVAVVIVSLGVICCCCRKKPKGKKTNKKDFEMDTSNVRPSLVAQHPPPPYTPRGMDNKALESSMELSLDDAAKAAPPYRNVPYAYHHTNGGVNLAYLDHSYSNSNHGSVHSQDSLWQVKGGVPNGGPNDANGPNGHVPNNMSNMGMERPMPYDPIAHGGYGGFDEMGPYVGREEYLGEVENESGVPGAMGDPYVAVHKPKKGLNHLDSPYHDVSGLPDPYADPDGDEPKGQHVSLSFDESLESGYSTPNSRNRRIIREIIV